MALSKTWSTPLFRTLCRENAKRLSDLGASPLKPPSHERKAAYLGTPVRSLPTNTAHATPPRMVP